MWKISRAALNRAQRFVAEHARPVDQALLEFQLADESVAGAAFQAVVRAIEGYQNPDGGFGHGIEPDVRTPTSLAISTSVGLQHLREIGATSRLPVVRKAMAYLVQTVDRERWVWPVIDQTVDAGPHAPWWNLARLDARFDGFVFNPTAELLGYLYDYPDLAPAEVRVGVERVVLEALKARQTAGDAYDLACCVRLLRSRGLPAAVRDVLESRILESLKAAELADLHLNFLQLTPTPQAFGYAVARAGIERQIERLIATQVPDGSWRPFWSWAEVDAAAWQVAELEWAGVLTRNAVVQLVRHGAVEETYGQRA